MELYAGRRPAEAIRLYEDMIAKRLEMALAYRHLAFGNPAPSPRRLRRCAKR
jgi:hypothetical protein